MKMVKRAIAYVRVSTRSDSQMHSFSVQDEYWRKVLSEKPEYEFVGIFADKGISGKSAENRKQYRNMVEAAKRGEFDTVFTKSVSRFGRNTQELLRSVRELKECGVNVIFETEHIDTAIGGSELQLTVAAAVAEDQLRSYGKNVQWSLLHKFQKGDIILGRIYGYKRVKGQLVVEESEAEVIRLIYFLYLNGMGRRGIVNELASRGIPPMKGGKWWSEVTIGTILKNEKYAGHTLYQKSIKVDGKTYREQNFAKQYFRENTHEAIIDQDTWDRAQAIRAERQTDGEKNPKDYAFRSKIICGCCGGGYVHKINNSGMKWAKPMWRCLNANRHGKTVCGGKAIYDSALEPLFVDAYNGFVETKGRYSGSSGVIASKDKLLEDERMLKALFIKNLISPAEFQAENEKILNEIKKVNLALKKVAMSDVSGKSAKPIAEFDAEKVKEYLERAVIKDGEVTFEFINGHTATMPYSNGQPGNQKGWMERRNANVGNSESV
jgi:DNA invertase Pin-like site-specific DNA recombinase